MTFNPVFREATRAQAKACILIEGPSGHGKSGLAMMIAAALSEWDWTKVAATDTENRSLDLFDGVGTNVSGQDFKGFKKVDLLESHGYRPTHYLACMERAIQDGALAYINDSSSHMWNQKGGMLQLVQDIMNDSGGKLNKWTAWGHPTAVLEKNTITKVIRSSEIHVISTARVKEKRELIDGKLVSLGMEIQQMPDLQYEPDLVLAMVSPGRSDGTPPKAVVKKTRYDIFTLGVTYEFNELLLNQLREYLNAGLDIGELKEQQRLERIGELSRYLDNNPSSAAIFPTLKEQAGLKDVALTDCTLAQVRQLTQMVMS